MSISGLVQFILGFLLGVSILTGTGAAAAYFFLNRMSTVPPKPTYSEESASESTEETTQSTNSNNSTTQAASSPPPEPEPEPEPPRREQTIEERFGQQAYEARVTWSSGLSLRNSPSASAARVGGVYYNDKLVVIEESSDGDWQKVYIPETGAQAWVKAGNVERVSQ